MQGKIYDCSDEQQRVEGIALAARAAESGQLIVTPTDTVYGLGCDAFDNNAVANLLAAKHRGPDMPVPVLIGSWDTAKGLVQTFTDQMQLITEAFWPGGLSIVVPQAPSLPWNLGDTRGTVMLRMPLHPIAIELLREVGPMAVSSANISGQAPATTAIAAKQQLVNLPPLSIFPAHGHIFCAKAHYLLNASARLLVWMRSACAPDLERSNP